MKESGKNNSEQELDIPATSEQPPAELPPIDDTLQAKERDEAENELTSAASEEIESEETDETREKLQEDEISSLKDRLLRAMAETENIRKRSIRDREEAGKYATTGFARDLLGIADNLRRALNSVPNDARGVDETLDNLLSGVEMIEREFASILERHNIKPISALGSKFDPNHHQALFEVPTIENPPGTIVEVVEIGYTISDRLLRPASVGVSTKPLTEHPDNHESDTLKPNSQTSSEPTKHN